MLEKFIDIFNGLRTAYGVTEFTGQLRDTDNKKLTKNYIAKQPVTDAHYQDHLDGKGKGLGIVPNTEENLCKWGVVDIDIYNLKHKDIINKVKDTPAVLFRSKSGGGHLYLFTSEWVTATLMRKKLKMLASYIGYADAELIPQADKKSEKGIGKYLNLPYHDANKSSRYAFDKESNPLSLEEFFIEYDKNVLTEKQLQDFKVAYAEKDKKEDDPFYGMPPCIKTLLTQGVGSGERNNVMTHLVVYFKKRFPEEVLSKAIEYNKKYFNPSMEEKRVSTTVESILKKDYNYLCKTPPMSSVCSPMECAMEKFGIGIGDTPNILPESLQKYDSDPPIFIVTIEGKQVDCTSEILWNPDKFGMACMEQVGVIMGVVSRPLWRKHLNKLFGKEVSVITAPESTKQDFILKDAFKSFVTRAPGDTIEDVRRTKSFTDKITNKTIFRWIDFWSYLLDSGWDQRRMDKIRTQKFFMGLYEGEEKYPKIGKDNKTTRVIEIPAEEIDKLPVRDKKVEDAPF